jgi:hypothetical protein
MGNEHHESQSAPLRCHPKLMRPSCGDDQVGISPQEVAVLPHAEPTDELRIRKSPCRIRLNRYGLGANNWTTIERHSFLPSG